MASAVDMRGSYHNVIPAEQAWKALSGLSIEQLVPSVVKKFEASPHSGQIVYFDPESIQADPATYQFRSGGDKKNGVTKQGKYAANKWDPVLHSNPILVHERLDGSVFVADGHHRLELAKRTNAAGTGPGEIAAIVLREADGYTPEDVRVIAAYKNMQHGRADVVDSARVFKEAASGRVQTLLLPQLQMDKGNLTLSYRLSKLSDKALDKVASGDVPADIAARVADKVADPARQEAVMGHIEKALKGADEVHYAVMHMEYPVVQEAASQSFSAKISSQRAGNTQGRNR